MENVSYKNVRTKEFYIVYGTEPIICFWGTWRTPNCSQPTTFLNGDIKTTFRVSNLILVQIDTYVIYTFRMTK